MRWKREKPNNSRHVPYSFPKRRRPPPQLPPSHTKDKPFPPPPLLAVGLPIDCSVLDLKARFEIYGSISRIRIDPLGVGSISFRSKSSAEAALVASLNPSFGISIDSHPIQVMWASETKEGEARDGSDDLARRDSNSSKLVKGHSALSRLGKVNKLSSAIVNPNATSSSSSLVLDPLFKAREIVAYDDLL